MAQPTDNHLCWGWSPSRPDDRTRTVTGLVDSSHPDRNERWSQPPAPPGERIDPAQRTTGLPSIAFTINHDEGLDLDRTVGGFDATARELAEPSAPVPQDHSEGPGEARFPEAGDGIAGFRLISELGRGAFGRVFLAEESLLGNRLVALKISKAEGDEPRLLARLQHTHIVPIHSVHDDPKTGLRVMCMPYFGGANLAQVLDAVAASRGSASGTRSLLHALDVIGLPRPSEALGPICPRRRVTSSPPGGVAGPLPRRSSGCGTGGPSGRAAQADGEGRRAEHHSAAPADEGTPSMPRWSFLSRVSGWSGSFAAAQRAWTRPKLASEPPADANPTPPARRFLREASYVRAAAWIIARLAEGLEHAHLHGLLHRDLKPSNILIAADGNPMLLDFNLAADATIKARESDRVRLGGTLPYMAPEHLDAFHPQGSTPPEGVDERSDIYALGLILYEIIAGRRPFAEPEPSRPILETIQAMIAERRAGAPSVRLAHPEVPADLDAVVRKCLHPDPDRRYSRAGDLAEDLQRVLDDQPLCFAVEPTWRGRIVKWLRRNPRATGASTMGLLGLAMIVFVSGAGLSVVEHLRVASARLKRQAFDRRFPEYQFLLNTVGGPAQSLDRGIMLAEETLDQAGIRLDGSGRTPLTGWLTALPLDEQQGTRRDLAEVILLMARARVFLADRSSVAGQQRHALDQAIAWLNRATEIDPRPTLTLFDDRATYRARLGDTAGAESDRRRARTIPAATGRDYYLQGTAMLARAESDGAEGALIKATILSPQGFWPYFALGLCRFDQKRYAEAAGDFTVCSVLAPEFAWPWVNRGLALAHANRLIEARSAYDRAIGIDETLADAWASRGLLALELDEPAAALNDLKRAIELGRDDVDIQAALGEALARSGQADAALRLLNELVATHPTATLPRLARGTLRLQQAPPGGEDDFQAILDREPRHAAAFLGLARAKRLTEPAEALRLALIARSIDPERVDAIELCAWLRGSLGDPEVLEDVTRLTRVPTRTRLYNAACSLGRYHQHQPDAEVARRAIDLVRRAVQLGIPTTTVRVDDDLASLSKEPAFQALLDLPPPVDEPRVPEIVR